MVGEGPSVRSTATVLFTDLVASTELRARLGEDAADELRRTHDRLLETAITNHGGHVVKGGGDGLVATFSSASDGLAAAVAAQQAIDRLNRQPRPVARLSVRMGLSAGDVTFEDGDVFGMPVVEAARLEAAAEGGQILCAEIVRILARGRGGVVEPIGFLDLKGLPEPLAACQVAWAPAEDPDRPDRPLPPDLAVEAAKPFVGRSDELAAIDAAIDESGTDAGLQVVWLSGEPGIGKTRLAAEAARRAHERGHLVLFGRCSEDLGVPYQPFVEALAALAALLPDDGLDTMAGPGGAHLARLVPDLAGRSQRLTPPPPSTTPEADQHRLYEAVRLWLAGLGPVLFVVDDIHWATAPTRSLLAHLARGRAPSNVVMLCTARDTAPDRTEALTGLVADLDRAGCLRLVDLPGLTAAETGDLVGDAGRGRLLHAETAGNPLFITTFQAERSGTAAIGVTGIVHRRLAGLPGSVAQALEVAAVTGLQFDLPVVAGALGLPDTEVLDALELAAAAGLAQETGPDRYQFTHALVRAALHDQLSASRRARVHNAIGRVLESQPERSAGERIAELAHHFAQALPVGDAAVAAHYAELAGRRAVELSSFVEAAEQYLFAAEHTPTDQLALRIDRLIAAGCAWRDDLVYGKSFELLELAVREAVALGDATRAVRAAVVYQDAAWRPAVQGAEAVALLEQALSITDDEDRALRCEALAALGLARYFGGQDGHEAACQAIELAEELDDARLLAYARIRYAHGHFTDPKDHGKMLEFACQVEEQAEDLGDEQLLILALNLRLSGEITLVRAGLGATTFARMALLVNQTRDAFYRHLLRVFELGYAWRRGDLEEVERLLSAETDDGEDARWKPPEGLEATRMFALRREQDRLRLLAPLLEQVLAVATRKGLWTAGLALLLAELGRPDEARESIGMLTDETGNLRLGDDHLMFLNGMFLAEAAFLAGDPRPAPAIVTMFRPLSGHLLQLGGGLGLYGPADRFLGLAAAAGGDLGTAHEALTAAAELSRGIEAPLWLATCLCDLADATGDPASLDEARRVAAGRDWPRVHRRVAQLSLR